jgi:GNAT superfamily N-acetyltransferase
MELLPATEQDRSFVEAIYFETQRPIIEELFGWRGDAFESANFRSKFYHEHDTSIIVVDGEAVGWLAVRRDPQQIYLDGIYLTTSAQNRGIGTSILRTLMDEAKVARLPLRLSAAKINRAVTLYERLGFSATHSDEFKIYMTFFGGRNSC